MIFGISHCRLSGSITVDLEHSSLDPSYIISDEIVHKSILTGHKTYNKRTLFYSSFIVDVNLFKYEESASVVLNNLMQLKKEYFYFYPHVDYNPISNLYGDPVKFHIEEITPYYLTQDAQYDAVRLQLSTINYTYLNIGQQISQGYGTYYGTGEYGLSGW